MFILGSPLGMFLALRDVEEHIYRHHKSAQSLLPASICKRIHNVHHPSDPVVSLCVGVCVCACVHACVHVCLSVVHVCCQ